MPNAAIRIERDGNVVAEAATDSDGTAKVPSPAAGEYVIAVTRDGFERSAQDVILKDARHLDIDFTLVTKITRNDNIDVVADLDPLKADEASPAAAKLEAAEVTSLPVRSATVADTLPLVPGIVRDANGALQISGQGEQRSALVVNASDVTDPSSGRFGTTVPVGSVESIDVFKTPFLPQYGNFTSGVVSVQTKRGGDKWHYRLREPTPDFRVRSGHLVGVRNYTPKFSMSGPVLQNRLYLSQSADYSLEKRQVRTLSFPHNESKVESVNSFTQLDYIQSANHFITGTVHVSPQHTNFVDPQFFNPQPVTPSFRGLQRSWTLIDHSGNAAGVLESTFSRQTYDARIGSQGASQMTLTPTGNLGSYFAHRTRDSSRLEWLETLSSQLRHRGTHDLKFGSVVARTANSGTFSFRPVEIVDENRRPIQKIDFTRGTPFDESDVEHALFAQDRWAPTSKLTFGGGLRAEHQTKSSNWRMAPRAGAAWTPLRGAGFVVRGGFGVFYDRVPLGVYSFAHYPEQIITSYDSAGQPSGSPRRFVNVIGTHVGKRFVMVKGKETSGNFAPYSETWSLEAEKLISKHLHLRAGYQHNSSAGGILIVPKAFASSGVLILEGSGRSLYRQFEVTAKVFLKETQQMLFSFVRSKSRGDLNAFNSYTGDYPMLPLRPNVFSNLPGDMPNRFLAWGFLNMPWQLRLAPVIEYRTGTPYAVLNAARQYAGIPYDDRTRLRNYFSADLRISREFKFLPKYRTRASVSGLNLTNHFNSLDAHANIADPQFGVLFGHFKRRYRADFEVLF